LWGAGRLRRGWLRCGYRVSAASGLAGPLGCAGRAGVPGCAGPGGLRACAGAGAYGAAGVLDRIFTALLPVHRALGVVCAANTRTVQNPRTPPAPAPPLRSRPAVVLLVRLPGSTGGCPVRSPSCGCASRFVRPRLAIALPGSPRGPAFSVAPRPSPCGRPFWLGRRGGARRFAALAAAGLLAHLLADGRPPRPLPGRWAGASAGSRPASCGLRAEAGMSLSGPGTLRRAAAGKPGEPSGAGS
jgi:hypothetical protein